MGNAELFLERYSNQIQTPGFGVPGQQALQKARVLVYGAGELATPVLSYLASMGIGQIGIADTEKIALRDLASQPLYFYGHHGKARAQIAAKQIREINPDTQITIHDAPLDARNVLNIIQGYDLVVDAGNRHEQTLLLNDACVITGKPLAFAALFPPTGYISVFNYKGGASYRCMLTVQDLSRNEEERIYGLAISAGITGTLLASEVIKIVAEIGDVASSKLLVVHTYSSQIGSLKIDPVPSNFDISSLEQHNKAGSVKLSDADPVRGISPRLLALKIKYKETLQLIDIRESSNEHTEEPDVLHLPAPQIVDRLDEVHQDIIVILLSEDGESAKRYAMLLNEQHGFDNIHYLEGGIEAWVQETHTAMPAL